MELFKGIICSVMECRKALLDRFIRYTAFDTMSDPSQDGKRRPTTEGQEKLLLSLCDELSSLGLDVYYGAEKVVMGTLDANGAEGAVAFMAHVDTADAVEGNGVKANVIESYDGSEIVLSGVSISPEKDTDLSRYIGSEIITSDGTTLLGSDDKAGVAIIMTALEYLVSHKEIRHPRIEVFFTPDEEIGAGVDEFPYERMKAKVCYTVDGEAEGEIETECFNAARVDIKISGDVCHLGSGRGKIHNAALAASAIAVSLPSSESPEATDGHFGYYALDSIKGNMEKAELSILLRDFDMESLERRIEAVRRSVSAVEALHSVRTDVSVKVQYRNMKSVNDADPRAMDAIRRSAGKLGIDIKEKAIRGGTDGARLAEHGIASPNIYTGGHNLHSLTEWVALRAMESSLSLVLGIIEEYS